MGSAGGWHRSSVTANDGEEFTCTIDLFNCEVDRFPYPDESFDTTDAHLGTARLVLLAVALAGEPPRSPSR